MDISVSPDAGIGALTAGAQVSRCAIGRGGIAIKGGEGDGITPVGTWPVRAVYYRADRVEHPHTALPVTAMAKDDGWCDAPDDPNYNRMVKLPYPASAETMWREDHLYDVVVVLGYNDDPAVPGRGSAIFLHVAKPDYAPTEGCVALTLLDLLKLLEMLNPGDSVRITE